MKLENKQILIISPESWGINFVSKHHYAIELSKKNHVVFLNPPSRDLNIKSIHANLKIVDYRPVLTRGINRLPAILRNYLNAIDIAKLAKRCRIESFDIVWTFDPFRFQNLKLFQSPLAIYHAVDVHRTPLEKEIAETADIVFTTSEIVSRNLIPINDHVFNIGHGVSDHFINQNRINAEMTGKLKVCMMGNLLRKIDYLALFRLMENHRDIEFHFIGPHAPSNLSRSIGNIREIERLEEFPNAFLHGSVPQEGLPSMLGHMDMFLILYRKDENPATLSNPHKVLEYLASGKVILSYRLTTHFDSRDLIKFTTREAVDQDFKDVVENIRIYNSENRIKSRKNLAAKNSYREKIMEIQQRINETLYPQDPG